MVWRGVPTHRPLRDVSSSAIWGPMYYGEAPRRELLDELTGNVLLCGRWRRAPRPSVKNEVRDERGTTRADDQDKTDPRAPPEPGPPKTRILRALPYPVPLVEGRTGWFG